MRSRSYVRAVSAPIQSHAMSAMIGAAALIAGLAICSAAWSETTPRSASGTQSIVPAPKPNGDADTPGGSAKNGVIKPPAMAGSTPVIRPPAQGTMPVIPPTGTARNNPQIVPK